MFVGSQGPSMPARGGTSPQLYPNLGSQFGAPNTTNDLIGKPSNPPFPYGQAMAMSGPPEAYLDVKPHHKGTSSN